jgi:DNA-binding response OmpR family regulator
LSKVLVVEDDQQMAHLLQTLLSLEGHEALATPRPDIIVDTVRRARPDVVVMDLHLGQVSTLDVLKKLKADSALKSIPVIIVSGLDAEDKCMQIGADAFMLKPYSPNALLDKIKDLAK